MRTNDQNCEDSKGNMGYTREQDCRQSGSKTLVCRPLPRVRVSDIRQQYVGYVDHRTGSSQIRRAKRNRVISKIIERAVTLNLERLRENGVMKRSIKSKVDYGKITGTI